MREWMWSRQSVKYETGYFIEYWISAYSDPAFLVVKIENDDAELAQFVTNALNIAETAKAQVAAAGET